MTNRCKWATIVHSFSCQSVVNIWHNIHHTNLKLRLKNETNPFPVSQIKTTIRTTINNGFIVALDALRGQADSVSEWKRNRICSLPRKRIPAFSAIHVTSSADEWLFFCCFFFPQQKTNGAVLSFSTHTEESHECRFINNNSISFNEHCRYIENKSGTGETSSRESWKCLE